MTKNQTWVHAGDFNKPQLLITNGDLSRQKYGSDIRFPAILISPYSIHMPNTVILGKLQDSPQH